MIVTALRTDFSKITQRLFTGSAIFSAADLTELMKNGVTHVIDATEVENEFRVAALNPKITYLWNGTKDDAEYKPSSWFEPAINFALKAFQTPGTVVYCHCFAGVNRGPSLAYAIMRAMGYARDEAYFLIKERRPNAEISYWRDAEAALKKLGWTK
jgi:protein-tyrosine phosphatase